MAEASQEPLQCKTLLLRVSIHCEGCKKKVKKVIQKIEGVHKVDIDSFQHKVTVTVTGNIDHDTLIRRLHKSGKQASIWPETKKPVNQIPITSADKKDQNKEAKAKEPKETPDKVEKQSEPVKDNSAEKEKQKDKVENKDEPKKPKPAQEKEAKKEKENIAEKPKDNEKEKEKEKEKPKEATKQEGTENNNGKKKKEKKEETETGNKKMGETEVKGISPSHPDPGFMYPYSYPYTPQPIMSYHMAQPSSSQAFYQQPPNPESSVYNYPYPYPYQNQYPNPYQNSYPYGPPPNEYPYGSNEPSRRDESMDYFNEENVNSCSVM